MDCTKTKRDQTVSMRTAYYKDGFVGPISIFCANEVEVIQRRFHKLEQLLPDGTDINFVRWWHQYSSTLFDLAADARILDVVQQVLGQNVVLWGSHFFAKTAASQAIVPWHQDGWFWPAAPLDVTTAYIAVTDCHADNGCMQVIPGSHASGIREHRVTELKHSVLWLELAEESVEEGVAVPLELPAGQMTLHHPALMHCSGRNASQRPRVGLALQYASTRVKFDTTRLQGLRTFLLRGIDEYGLNPSGIQPIDDRCPPLESTGE